MIPKAFMVEGEGTGTRMKIEARNEHEAFLDGSALKDVNMYENRRMLLCRYST